MISKLITGNGFGGAVRYSTKYGKDPDGTLHQLLAVNGVTFDYDENGELTINPQKVGWDFRQQTLGYNPGTNNYRPIQKPVYHWILSWKEGERKIPPKEMLEVAKEFMKRIGFTNTQYVISAHFDKENQHLHIVANIVNNDGKRIVSQGLVDLAHKVAADITMERGYEWGKPATKKTIKSAKKPHEKVRYTIKPIVKEAVAKAKGIEDLPALLKLSKISCKIKHSEIGKVVGISFAYEMDGQLHTFRGSSLDRSLSAGRIEKAIACRQEAEEVAVVEAVRAGSNGTKITVGLATSPGGAGQEPGVNQALVAVSAAETPAQKPLLSASDLKSTSALAIGRTNKTSLVERGTSASHQEPKVQATDILRSVVSEKDAVHSIQPSAQAGAPIVRPAAPITGTGASRSESTMHTASQIVREAVPAGAKYTLPKVIHVTPENYDSILLPEGYRAYEKDGYKILSTPADKLVIEGRGLVLVRDKDGEFECRTAEHNERIRQNRERFQKNSGLAQNNEQGKTQEQLL